MFPVSRPRRIRDCLSLLLEDPLARSICYDGSLSGPACSRYLLRDLRTAVITRAMTARIIQTAITTGSTLGSPLAGHLRRDASDPRSDPRANHTA